MSNSNLEETTHLRGGSGCCRNCGAVADGKFCPACGQETFLHVPSAGEFIHELVGHFIVVERSIGRTLRLLLLKPGALTVEYLAGRRAFYVRPLRLYLTLSLLFFALLQFGNYTFLPTESAKQPLATAGLNTRAGGDTAESATSRNDASQGEKDGAEFSLPSLGGYGPHIAENMRRLASLPIAEQSKILTYRIIQNSPYAMFLLLPLLALYLKLLYLGIGRYYGEYLLFALHTNAFAFVMLCAILLAPWALLKWTLGVWLVIYLPLAMHNVFGGGRFGTVWRWLVLILAYWLSLLVSIAGMLALATIA